MTSLFVVCFVQIPSATEFLERLVYYGICFNLLTYLVDVLHEDTAQSVSNLNNWQGMSWILPLFGAFVADEFLGRYTTIVVSGFIYILVRMNYIKTKSTT